MPKTQRRQCGNHTKQEAYEMIDNLEISTEAETAENETKPTDHGNASKADVHLDLL
jgi:hypothetical protein